MTDEFDILVVGAGAAGMPAAIFASREGARVLVVESEDQLGGTFHRSGGQMSAAGTRIQAAKGIHDTPQMHFADVMRISRGAADPAFVRLAVDNAADTLHWLLDSGFEPLPEHPVITLVHEPYSVPRTYWGKDAGRSVMRAIIPQYELEARSGRITTWLKTELVRLTLDADGAVTGAVVRQDGMELAVSAGKVILAAGGYTANRSLFERLSGGRRLYGGGYIGAQGTGLTAAVAAGSEIINTDKFLSGFAGVEDPEAPSGITVATQTTPQLRQPWEIYVDVTGRRFMREDEPSIDVREHALRDLPELAFWAVYDEGILRDAPPFFSVSAEAAAARFGVLSGYQRADSLVELAKATGMDATKLKASIDAYNHAVATGAPDPTGREHRPRGILEAPFYAVRHVGWSITGFAGLKVDPELRVLTRDGVPIPGLYAAGEILGLGKTMGESFVGGMSVTPAMTFGRLLGTRLGSAVARAP
jgi:fumarate reductase flavoprotein subunit